MAGLTFKGSIEKAICPGEKHIHPSPTYILSKWQRILSFLGPTIFIQELNAMAVFMEEGTVVESPANQFLHYSPENRECFKRQLC